MKENVRPESLPIITCNLLKRNSPPAPSRPDLNYRSKSWRMWSDRGSEPHLGQKKAPPDSTALLNQALGQTPPRGRLSQRDGRSHNVVDSGTSGQKSWNFDTYNAKSLVSRSLTPFFCALALARFLNMKRALLCRQHLSCQKSLALFWPPAFFDGLSR